MVAIATWLLVTKRYPWSHENCFNKLLYGWQHHCCGLAFCTSSCNLFETETWTGFRPGRGMSLLGCSQCRLQVDIIPPYLKHTLLLSISTARRKSCNTLYSADVRAEQDLCPSPAQAAFVIQGQHLTFCWQSAPIGPESQDVNSSSRSSSDSGPDRRVTYPNLMQGD